MDDSTEDGRARNKRATRRALRRAVLDLGEGAGLAAITVDEIAAHAGVSPRTFFNYFDTKEDAAVVELFSEVDGDLAAFAAGLGDDPWSELSTLMVEAVSNALKTDPDLLALLQLHASDPAMQARQIRYFGEFIGRLSHAVAARLGKRKPRMTADLMAGSCITAVRVALDHWTASGGRGQPTRPLLAAFAAFAPAFGPTEGTST